MAGGIGNRFVVSLGIIIEMSVEFLGNIQKCYDILMFKGFQDSKYAINQSPSARRP